MVEATTRCNAGCRHCFRLSVPGGLTLGDMPWETYRRVLGEAVECGVKRLVFSGWGEPTVHR
ncbi:MAG: tungsten cofactor oxidoreducase radical SAM maturase, partial [Candidatus Bathyarchaeota archaeon B23]